VSKSRNSWIYSICVKWHPISSISSSKTLIPFHTVENDLISSNIGISCYISPSDHNFLWFNRNKCWSCHGLWLSISYYCQCCRVSSSKSYLILRQYSILLIWIWRKDKICSDMSKSEELSLRWIRNNIPLWCVSIKPLNLIVYWNVSSITCSKIIPRYCYVPGMNSTSWQSIHCCWDCASCHI